MVKVYLLNCAPLILEQIYSNYYVSQNKSEFCAKWRIQFLLLAIFSHFIVEHLASKQYKGLRFECLVTYTGRLK